MRLLFYIYCLFANTAELYPKLWALLCFSLALAKRYASRILAKDNCFLGALLDAGAAVSALCLVDGGYIVLYGDRTVWTVLFTDVTGDASNLAVLIDELTHILGLAGHCLTCVVRDKIN